MKLLFVARRYPPDVRGGSETAFEALYQAARRRHQVTLIAGFARSRAFLPPEAVPIDLRSAPPGAAHLLVRRAARRVARRLRPDVVLSSSVDVATTGRPTVCLAHDPTFGEGGRTSGWLGGLREQYYRRQALRAAHLVAPSEACAETLVSRGVSPERLQVVPHPIDIDAFASAPPVSPMPEGVLRIAYPGRIFPGKGQHLAIDAIARLPPDAKARVRLDIVGAVADRIYFDQLRVQAAHQPVRFFPDVNDIAPFYRADLIAYTTLVEEGFGFTAVEAMASGRAVAWTEQPALREVTGGLGYPLPRGDALALRDLVARLIDDPSELVAIGAAGRQRAARYHREEAWRALEDVLYEAAGD